MNGPEHLAVCQETLKVLDELAHTVKDADLAPDRLDSVNRTLSMLALTAIGHGIAAATLALVDAQQIELSAEAEAAWCGVGALL